MPNGGTVRVAVRLDRPTTQATSLRLRTRDLTAHAGRDYTAFTWSVRFAPGARTATLHVSPPGRGSFRLLLDRPVGLTLTARTLDVPT